MQLVEVVELDFVQLVEVELDLVFVQLVEDDVVGAVYSAALVEVDDLVQVVEEEELDEDFVQLVDEEVLVSYTGGAAVYFGASEVDEDLVLVQLVDEDELVVLVCSPAAVE